MASEKRFELISELPLSRIADYLSSLPENNRVELLSRLPERDRVELVKKLSAEELLAALSPEVRAALKRRLLEEETPDT